MFYLFCLICSKVKKNKNIDNNNMTIVSTDHLFDRKIRSNAEINKNVDNSIIENKVANDIIFSDEDDQNQEEYKFLINSRDDEFEIGAYRINIETYNNNIEYDDNYVDESDIRELYDIDENYQHNEFQFAYNYIERIMKDLDNRQMMKEMEKMQMKKDMQNIQVELNVNQMNKQCENIGLRYDHNIKKNYHVNRKRENINENDNNVDRIESIKKNIHESDKRKKNIGREKVNEIISNNNDTVGSKYFIARNTLLKINKNKKLEIKKNNHILIMKIRRKSINNDDQIMENLDIFERIKKNDDETNIETIQINNSENNNELHTSINQDKLKKKYKLNVNHKNGKKTIIGATFWKIFIFVILAALVILFAVFYYIYKSK